MKIRFAAGIILFLIAIQGLGQDNSSYKNNWEGTLDLGVKLRIVFHIKDNGAGGLIATADSPDQSAYGFKCDTVYVSANFITIELRDLNASFTGSLINDSVIQGTFKQNAEVPLTLKKVKTASGRLRPQQPTPPFPYFIYDVGYENSDKTIRYGATLTVPKPDSGRVYIKSPVYPVAILITGSGQQDRDETLAGHKPFAVIADHLSRNGFAVLRVDDRGIGQSTGDVKNATSADFAKDVEASINYLLTRSDIDKKKIGLIGHSEGGMIAPIVANSRTDICFIILLAAPGIPILDLMAEQNEAILTSSAIDPEAVKKFIPLYKRIIPAIANAKDSSFARSLAVGIAMDWAMKTDQKTKESLGFTDEQSIRDFASHLVPAVYTTWYHYFINYDPQPPLQKIKAKVLALNGSKDLQVISSSNLAGIKASLKKSKSPAYEVMEINGLNHLFQRCSRCTLTEYAELEETFSPEVLQIMTQWLNRNVK
jgi:uncharacterized protein